VSPVWRKWTCRVQYTEIVLLRYVNALSNTDPVGPLARREVPTLPREDLARRSVVQLGQVGPPGLRQPWRGLPYDFGGSGPAAPTCPRGSAPRRRRTERESLVCDVPSILTSSSSVP
jgi:hypothetical protein